MRQLLATATATITLVTTFAASAQPAPPPAQPAAPAPYAAPSPYPPPGPPPGQYPYGYGYPQYPYGASPYVVMRPPAPPPTLSYTTGQPIPPGYHLESGPRLALVIPGAAVLGSFWAISVSVAAGSTNDADRYLYIPTLGPIIDLASRNKDCTQTFADGTSSSVGCVDESGNRILLTFDAIAQLAGTTLLIFGLALPRKFLVYDGSTGTTGGSPRSAVSSLVIGPQTFGGHGMGLAMAGQLF